MDCPSDDQLRAYLSAAADGDAAIAEHLVACSKCRSRLEGLDSTVPHLRPQSPAGAGSSADVIGRGTALGRFVVLSELGRGGMGVVYAAYDPILERKVALKILRVDNLAEEKVSDARARLLREAKAAARLSHPNVVTVYEAGVYGQQSVCVAMEFVDGDTLKHWQREEQRDWREIVLKYADAALGLDAAHKAGLVHRDFKPANVLVGKDGRVRVADFGLARAHSAAPVAAETAQSGITLDSVQPSDQLTHPGTLVGTPAYMAPEQIIGEGADARSDQFSFGIALYEALCGTRPFRGDKLADVLRLMKKGVYTDLDKLKGPRRLRKAVLRALSYHREDRFPSMEALARELRRTARQRRARLLVQAAAGAAVLAGLALVALRAPAVACEVKAADIDESWSASRRQKLLEGWLGENGAATRADLERPLKLIDRYVDSWQKASVAACDAALVKKVHSSELYDRQTACLGQLRRDLDATVSVIARSRAKDVSKAIEAAAALAPVLRCSPEEIVTRRDLQVPPAKKAQVEELTASLAALRAQRLFDASGALTDGEQLLKATDALGFLPLHAEALEVVGQLHTETQQLEAAQQVLERALSTAERAGYDELRLRAQVDLAALLGFRNTRFKEAHFLLDRSRALLERLGKPLELEVDLTTTEAMVLFNETHYELAHAKFARAVELVAALVGKDHPRVARARANLAQALKGQGAFAEAEAMAKAAAQTLDESAGPDHRWTRVARYSLATIYLRSGRGGDALREFHAAQPDWQEGEVTLENTAAQIRYALAHVAEDELGAAAKILDAVDAYWKQYPPQEQTSQLDMLFARSEVAYGEGRYDVARKLIEERAARTEKIRGVESHGTAEALVRLARLQLELDELDAAGATLLRARKVADVAVKPGDLLLAELMGYEGELLALRNNCAQARPIVDRAMSVQDGRESDPARTARVRMVALLCPSNDPHRDALIRAALTKQLQVKAGWARAIKARLDRHAQALAQP